MARIINLMSLCDDLNKLEKELKKFIKFVNLLREEGQFIHIRLTYKIKTNSKSGYYLFTKSYFNNRRYDLQSEVSKLKDVILNYYDFYQNYDELNKIISYLRNIKSENYFLNKEKYKNNIDFIFQYLEELIYLADSLYESRDAETLSDFIPKEIHKKYKFFMEEFPLKALKETLTPLNCLERANKPHPFFLKTLNKIEILAKNIFRSVEYLSSNYLLNEEFVLDDFYGKDLASQFTLKVALKHPGTYICLDNMEEENFEKIFFFIKNQNQELLTDDDFKCICINKLKKNMETPKSILKSKESPIREFNKVVRFEEQNQIEKQREEFKSTKNFFSSLNPLDCMSKKKYSKEQQQHPISLVGHYKEISENSKDFLDEKKSSKTTTSLISSLGNYNKNSQLDLLDHHNSLINKLAKKEVEEISKKAIEKAQEILNAEKSTIIKKKHKMNF